MDLWLLQRPPGRPAPRGEHVGFVIAAWSSRQARQSAYEHTSCREWDWMLPEHTDCTKVGSARAKLKQGVVLSSFNPDRLIGF